MMTILQFVKNVLGIHMTDNAFDSELLMHINSAIQMLVTFGVEQFSTVYVEKDTPWTKLDPPVFDSLAKAYLGSKVKIMFDPPTHGALLEAHAKSVDEIQLRLQVLINEKDEVDNG